MTCLTFSRDEAYRDHQDAVSHIYSAARVLSPVSLLLSMIFAALSLPAAMGGAKMHLPLHGPLPRGLSARMLRKRFLLDLCSLLVLNLAH